jgi:hypothetical protein
MIIVIGLTLVFGLLIICAALEHWSGIASFLLLVAVLLGGALLALVIDGLAWIENALREFANRLEDAQSL